MSSENVAAATTPEKVEQAEAPPLAPETPLTRFTARLDDIIKQTGHGEMWGVELSSDASHAPTQVVLQKFLRANNGDLAGAEKQFTAALEWRKKMNPPALVAQAYDKRKFEGLGFVTNHKDEAGKNTTITWNIYGSVKDNKATFGDITEFIKWRTALMELGVQQLHLNDIKEPLPEDGTDEHQMLQVHDYRSVSFFRMDPAVKAASKETISVFSTAYPELLAHKYFVNVPAIMGWMFGAMKLFLAPATLKKFHPMASGASLSNELKSIASTLPQEYGGSGSAVQEGLTIALVDTTEAAKESPAESKAESVAAEANEAAAAAAEPQTVDIPVRPKEEEEEAPVEAKKEEVPAPVEAEVKAEEEKAPVEAKKEAEEKKEEEVKEEAKKEDVKDEEEKKEEEKKEEEKKEEEKKEEEKKEEEAPVTTDDTPKESEAAPQETQTAETAQPEKTA
ncbi:phosphatidylinositol transfer [Trichoderma arundinaceum]|uniref:Phosphatidylinositol transfer protein SFH5 n=1 Tax=Trichoderma arundinaceum TaxID=490622 RepID=A0A395NSY6_TRIAR|nr:phosphatidylinositol transfer [Trichoderma arundinaceum]